MNTSPQKSSESNPFMPDDIGNVLQVLALRPDGYLQEEIYTRMVQSVDPNFALRDINEAHCRTLIKSYHEYNYYYARGMMKVWSFST